MENWMKHKTSIFTYHWKANKNADKILIQYHHSQGRGFDFFNMKVPLFTCIFITFPIIYNLWGFYFPF